MKLWDKIKNSIFEEDEIEETEVIGEVKEKPIVDTFKDDVVKKIDIEKTIPKRIELPKEEVVEEKKPILPKREHRVTPMIFDEDDFIMEDDIPITPKKEVVKEDVKRPLYSGYKDDKQKEKFKPSPIISPVYGFVGVSPVLEQPRNEELSSFNEMFAKEKKETVTVDAVRQKAYGVTPTEKNVEEDDDLGLLYEMKQDESPAISKITLGDAEEYFDDLGLEYNVDYKDSAKENSAPIIKGKKKVEDVKEDTLDEINIDLENTKEHKLGSTKDLEITKEQLKPKTAKEIKKVKNIKDLDVEEETEEPDEKNLYDLIDMMYESKE
ncbi:MAG: hypothetical protein IJL74_03445 [Bacilli bacterium]|nr:hypothetical protein [Bacilli bacterium]